MAGRIRQIGQQFTRELKGATSLKLDGLVMKSDADGVVDICGADDTPYAISYQSTQDRVSNYYGTEKFLTGADVGHIALYRSGWAVLNLKRTAQGVASNVAINIGDPLTCSGDGLVDKWTAGTPTAPTSWATVKAHTVAMIDDYRTIIGYAEEKKVVGAAGTDLTIKASLALTPGAGP